MLLRKEMVLKWLNLPENLHLAEKFNFGSNLIWKFRHVQKLTGLTPHRLDRISTHNILHLREIKFQNTNK